MIALFRHLLGWIVSVFRSREDLILENLALRRQLLALHARRPRRRLSALQKLFWLMLRKLWAGWQKPLLLVTPRTVVHWHRAGFRFYWKWLSRTRHMGGRKAVSQEIRALIFRMAAENSTWGAPRIHGELLKLGWMYRKRRSHAGFGKRRELLIPPSAGSRSSGIIVRRSRRWTSLRYRRLLLGCCTAFSSSVMTGARFYVAT
jgi:hypothetical protein